MLTVFDPTSTRGRWLLPLGVALCALLTYASSLGGGFLLDDSYLVVGNASIRSLSDVPTLLTHTMPGRNNIAFYRPLLMVSLAIDYALHGLAPAGYHASNVLLHALVSVLVFWFLRRILDGVEAPLIGALIFAVHPVHGEAVYLVSNRATELSTTFALLVLLVHVAPLGAGWQARATWLATAPLAFCAVASKEDAVVLPGLLVLFDILVRPRGARAIALRVLPAFGGVLACLVVRAAVCRTPVVTYFGDAPAATVVRTMVPTLARALRLLVMPYNLGSNYGPDLLPDPGSFASAEVLGGAAVLLAALATIVLCRQRRPALAFGVAMILLCLAPMTHVVGLPVLFAERFLYLCSVGFCLVAAVTYGALALRTRREIAWGLASVLVLGWAAQTFERAADWRDELTFWRFSAADRPRSLQAQYSLAHTLSRERGCAAALAQYDVAVALAGNDAPARTIRLEQARCYDQAGDRAHARALVDQWLSRHPGDVAFERLAATLETPR